MRTLYLFILLLFSNFLYAQIPLDLINLNGEKPDRPRLLAPGIITSGLHEHSGFIISPSNNFALWTVSLKGHKIILQLKRASDYWIGPEVASFSGQYRDEFQFFSPDGNTIYFNSYRPEHDKDNVKTKFLHWMVELEGDNWGEPKRNLKWHPELWPYSMSIKENVFGWANLDTTKRDADIYMQRKLPSGYSDLIKLSDSINSDAIEYCPYIDKEEMYIIFCRMGAGDLDGIYVSFKRNDGKWTQAQRLPEVINQGYAERFPVVSPDGKYLFFNRQTFEYKAYSLERLNFELIKEKHVTDPLNGSGDIYWVDMDVIYELKPKYIK